MGSKDKAKVIDEVWTEERVLGFLEIRDASGELNDFHALLKAYRSMRADDFSTFLQAFVAAGRSVLAAGPDGRTIIDIVSEHRRSGEYLAALEAAIGAP
jgi:hypothetical protein